MTIWCSFSATSTSKAWCPTNANMDCHHLARMGNLCRRRSPRWTSTSPFMLKRLSNKCRDNRLHQPLESGRHTDATYDSLKRTAEILLSMRDTTDRRHLHHYEGHVLLDSVLWVNAIASAMPAPAPHADTDTSSPIHHNHPRPHNNNTRAMLDILTAPRQRPLCNSGTRTPMNTPVRL